MKTIIKVVLAVALLTLCVYIEDYVQRCAAMFVGAGIAVLGLAVGDKTDLRKSCRDFLGALGTVIYFGFLVGIAVMEIHIEQKAEGIVVRSPFYTHVLERGNRMETKKLRSYYTQYCSKFEVKKEAFYFIYNGDSCSIFNKYGMILKIPKTSYKIEQKDFGNGELDYIVLSGKTYDLRGTEIKELNGYKPYVSDRTADYTSSPLN